MAGYLSSSSIALSSEDNFALRLPNFNKFTHYYNTPESPTDDTGLSLLYTTLPSIVQRRMPKIRSIRSSIYATPKTPLRSRSVSSTASTSSESPPPSYRTRPSSSASFDETDSDEDLPDLFTSAPSSRPSTSGSATPANLLPAFTRQDETPNSATSNKSGQHGLALLNLSMRDPASTNDPLNRRLYIDGISYILRGLPSDLTEEEALVLREAAPEALQPAQMQLTHQPTTSTAAQTPQTAPPAHPPTILHRTSSALTFYTLLLLTLLLPHVRDLLTTLHTLDTRHRVSARFFAQTNLLLRMLAAQAIALVALAWDANDGAVRHACRDFGVWVLRDVCGGVDEGVGRAVGVLRVEGREEREGK
ncbi:hypothetical protein Q7P37_005500 [Cladosporium fusiforme]